MKKTNVTSVVAVADLAGLIDTELLLAQQEAEIKEQRENIDITADAGNVNVRTATRI
jgi:2-hydroxychromene-2-carboxylate isomerase